MFKRLRRTLFIMVLLILIGQVGVLAHTQSGDKINVYDYLNYLSDDEVIELQTAINSVSNDYNLDVVVVITDQTDGKSSMEFADDFYDSNGFGKGEDYSGLLMLINMAEREVWISTAGKGIDIFTDSRISKMVAKVTAALSNGRFFDACKIFINEVCTYAQMGIPEGQFRLHTETKVNRTYLEKVQRLMRSIWVYIVALLIAGIATLIFSILSNGRVTVTSRTYEEDGSFTLLDKWEGYLRQSTTVTIIESGSGSGGSNISSTHTSSSGRIHGGGGGKF